MHPRPSKVHQVTSQSATVGAPVWIIMNGICVFILNVDVD